MIQTASEIMAEGQMDQLVVMIFRSKQKRRLFDVQNKKRPGFVPLKNLL